MERIDDCLSVRDSRLFIEECDTTRLVREFGSPIFALSEAQLRSNFRRFRDSFSRYWQGGPVDIMPALKANPTLATRQILTEEGAGADIYSEGELYGALSTGVNPERVSVNGGGKSERMIRKCVETGVRITVEDLDEPALVDRIAGEMGRTAKVRLRVKPNFPNLWRTTHFAHEYATIDLGIQTYKSGIPAQYLPGLGREVLGLKNLELTGFHLHLGRHHPSLWYWRGAMKQYARLIVELCRAWGGYRPLEIDVGGGFAVDRDPFDKAGTSGDVVLTLLSYPLELGLKLGGDSRRYRLMSALIDRFFAKSPSRKRAPSIEQYAEATVTSLEKEFARLGFDTRGIRLQVEPGRCLYGNIGIHLTTVKKVKRQTSPIKLNWILTDTTWFFLTGGMLHGNLHDFRVANKADAPAVEVADIVGQSCSSDRILPFMRVPRVEPGDVVALFDAGAYEEVSASNFNALPRPATVLVNGDRAELIRRAETIQNVFGRDTIPERLVTTEQETDHRDLTALRTGTA
jgi:diaminopimelate decarboxylase